MAGVPLAPDREGEVLRSTRTAPELDSDMPAGLAALFSRAPPGPVMGYDALSRPASH
jgi:hypothetical protein